MKFLNIHYFVGGRQRSANFLSFKQERGQTVILLVLFIVAIMLMIASSAAALMIYQIQMSGEIADSVPAFYAADAAAEECLYQIWTLPANSGEDCTKNNKRIWIYLDNGATGSAIRGNSSELSANGVYSAAKRQVELDW